MFRRRRRWPAALGLSAGGVVAVAAAVYLVFSFVAGPGPELIKQTLASASEKAFLDRTKHRDELREEWEARVGKARGTQEALKRKAEAEAAEELASFAEQQRRRKVDAASEQARQLAGLEAKAAGLRQAAEEKKAAAAESAKAGAAAAAGAGTGAAGTDAGKGAVAVKDAGKKDLGKKDAGKKDLGKKDAGKGEAKKAEAPKVEEKKEEVAKAEEKKVEAPPEEAKKDDAKEILKGLDEKKDESAGAGGDTGKKTLTMGDITKVVNQNKPEMKACFEKYGAGLESATIRTKVTIAASGEVTAVTISSMEFAGTALGNCVRKVQLGMKFPATATQQTKSISVRLP
jgi:hypothetical protein